MFGFIPLAARICVALISSTFMFISNASAQTEPIRVGFLAVSTGPAAAVGKQMTDGMTLFLKERNYTLSGRKVELITSDTTMVPAIAKTKTQELIERHKVHVIIGPLAAFEALAIDDNIRQAGMPIILSAAAEDLTQRKTNPWFVRSTTSSSQFSHPLGEYAAKELKYKRIAILSDDIAFGHEQQAGFQRAFEENGGKIVQKLWTPLSTPDYASYIAQIKPNIDAVYINFVGANASRFLKQYKEYGLKGKIPVLASMITVDEALIAFMGSEAEGVISAGWYSAANPTPENKAFVDNYRKDYKSDPGFYSTGAYAAGLILEQALKTVGGKVEDKQAFMKALRAVKIEKSPRGPIALDEYGNPVADIYIRKTERKDGKLQNTVIKIYPKVSQFWTYDPKKFLANPVYSRDYPPAKNLE